MSAVPKTTEEILATGIMDPDFEAAWKARGSPPGDMPAGVATLKRMIDASLPDLQSRLSATRPPNITETEHSLPLSTGYTSRILVCHAIQPDSNTNPSPIILLFHGGIHVLGHPEFDLPLARRLAHAHNATVLCPSTRKAPEHPFPAMIDDAWAVLQAIAGEASSSPSSPQRRILPAHASAEAGFLLAGTSSGANIADVLAHLARDAGLVPGVTGQALVCGGFIDPGHVPEEYRGWYLSREQNAEAPVVNARFLEAITEAVRPDRRSPLWAPFVQCWGEGTQGRDGGGGSREVAEGHKGMPKVYFQVCGLDVNRDDSLIYERVLSEECGIATRVDLYAGFPHCWWDMYPDLEASRKRMEDMINGVGWLLGKETVPGDGTVAAT
jgi:acetyl esterase/lipase